MKKLTLQDMKLVREKLKNNTEIYQKYHKTLEDAKFILEGLTELSKDELIIETQIDICKFLREMYPSKTHLRTDIQVLEQFEELNKKAKA